MDQPFQNNNGEYAKSDAYQQQVSQQYPPAPEQQQYAPPPQQQQQYPPPQQQQYTPQPQQQNYPPQQQQQQQFAPPPPQQQQYTPPPPQQYQQQQGQQVQMANMPPQQQQAPPPPSHSTVIISSGQQHDNSAALQNQQMALNAQLIQSLQNNTRGLPTSVAGATLPVHIYCNSCKQESVTRVTENPCTLYSCLWFFCCFYSILVLLCFIPGMCKNQHQFTHYCSNCGFKVGEKPAQC